MRGSQNLVVYSRKTGGINKLHGAAQGPRLTGDIFLVLTGITVLTIITVSTVAIALLVAIGGPTVPAPAVPVWAVPCFQTRDLHEHA